MSYLEVKNLSVYHKKNETVRGVCFCAKRGELIALLGLNASGKTTLIKGICALLETKGEVIIGGKSSTFTPAKEMQRLISYIPQRHNINFHISVLEVALMGFAPSMSLFENYSDAQREKARISLEVVDMGEHANNDFMILSEGQKQLVVLARALVQENDLMIFDEPDSAMDFNNKHLILSKIKEAVNEKKCGILCLHDANFALKYCDKALLMKDGKLIDTLDIKKSDIREKEKKLSMIYENIKIVEANGDFFVSKAY